MGFSTEIEIDVGRWMRAILQKWWLIVMTTMTAFCITLVVSLYVPVIYTAKTAICIDASVKYNDADDMLYYLQECAVIGGRGIAERALLLLGDKELTAEEIIEMVEYSYEDGGIAVYIEASHENSQLAIDVADAVAESLRIEAQSILRSDAFNVLEQATLEDSDASLLKICILGALIGFILPIIVIIFKQVTSDKIYYVFDAELNGELELIGIIPEQIR